MITVSTNFGKEITAELIARGYPVLYDIFDLQADFLSHYPWAGKTVIEFGAYDGRHSEVALTLGAEFATVIEGRAENLKHADPAYPELVRFIVDDIRCLRANIKTADVGLIFGVLYHLDNPVKFLRDTLPHCRQAVFIWTHVGSTIDMNCESYFGQAYNDPGISDNCALEPLTAFWFSQKELVRCLDDNGFRVTDIVDMPTPVTQAPAVCLRAERVTWSTD
jgi:2-polyprenyl-3-methyl-5-hydroxy-6-metoxy-1,4-benzoquinol methylase